MKLKTLTQTYNDGILSVYNVENIAEQGNLPKEGLVIKTGPLRYEERIVGISRFWSAKQAQLNVHRMLRVPLMRNISPQDIAVPIDNNQYKIVQIQYVKGVEPPSMDLSLERLEVDYEIN